MTTFEITINGDPQAVNYATQAEADAAAATLTKGSPAKTISVRPKAAAEQGTPGNPAGSKQG